MLMPKTVKLIKVLCFSLFFIAIYHTSFAATINVGTTVELRQALLDAAGNGQSDTIILADGTYATTDDSGGAFTFLDNENYDLTLQGSSAENVILSGDNTHQVLYFEVINSVTTIYLNNLSIQYGSSDSEGGGVVSDENLSINNCKILRNSASHGGGFYTSSEATVTNSIISENASTSDYGGGFASYSATVTNSIVSKNTSTSYGGGFYSYLSVTIIDSTILGNSSSSAGGGFVSTSVTIQNSTISENLSSNHDGGGFYSLQETMITDSAISKNTSAYDGGGFYSGSIVTVKGSIISENSSSATGSGGGFYSYSNATITNSTISGNSSGSGGGFYSLQDTTVTDSIISENSSDLWGGGFYSLLEVTVTGSIISGNVSYFGAGFYSGWNATVMQSTFSDNLATLSGGAFRISKLVTVSNSLFINNGDVNGIYLSSGETHQIVNSIFLNNGSHDIAGDSGVIVSMNNNYIDETRIDVLSFKSNNIYGGDLGFVDQVNGDYHIGENSVLVDAGTNTIAGITFPEIDLDGNDRIVGTSIDIGPYEYQLVTKPTINSFSYSGTPKVGVDLTFSVVATPYEGRSISLYEIDSGDGNFIAASSSVNYTYSTPGNYTARAKVTDSEGEYSITSLDLNIADLTTEEKIAQAYENGKQYVQDNPSAFGLVTIAEKDQAVADAETAKDLIIADYAENVLYLLYGDFDMNSSVDGYDLSLFSKSYGHIAIDVDNDTDGYSEIQGDCDDTNIAINPDAAEVCGDQADNNCDGQEDEGC